jgi:sugar lactone lactonase YvrE
VYIADTYNSVIKKWTETNNTVSVLASSGVSMPQGVVVDGAGNVYFSDGNRGGEIQKWASANSNLTVVVSANSNPAFGTHPQQIALDFSGNIYVADEVANDVEMWSPVNSNVTVLVSSGLSSPYGVAADGTGNNVFIADTSHNAIKQWQALTKGISTVVSSGLNNPHAVAVDGSGNLIISDVSNSSIKKWWAASNLVTTLASSSSGVSGPVDAAVDAAGNIYIADSGFNAIEEIPYAFVPAGPVMENGTAGQDSLPVVLPATANLQGSFAPVSDVSWLTINGVTNGVVYFSFTGNPLYAPVRTGHIILLGQRIAITQAQLPYQIPGTTNLLVGPSAGSNSVSLQVVPATDSWAASANDSWLYLTPANQTGTGGTNIIFSYDANTSAVTRTGTLTIGGQTVYVTQAGSNYVSARVLTTLTTKLGSPYGLTVDGSGNVYLADSSSNMISEWVMASNTQTNLVTSGLVNPGGVAVDGAGNVYIADSSNRAIKKWLVASHNVVTVASSSSAPISLGLPQQLALDAAGDILIADSGNNGIEEWVASNSNVVNTVSSGLSGPVGVASDFGGNTLYITDTAHNAVKKWTAASGITTLVSSGLVSPHSLAIDGSGNIYIANSGNSIINEWTATSGTVTNLIPVAAGLVFPSGVAVDMQGNLYISDGNRGTVRELTYAFVNPAPVVEGPNAGSDVLPTVLPVTENLLAPFAPTNDSTWLAITGVTNGIISFAFTANTNNTSRTAHIGVLGQVVPITQSGLIPPTPPLLTTVQLTGDGALQFSFTNSSTASFTVWSTTNLMRPFTNWTMAGAASNLGSGLFQFRSPPATNMPGLFYRVTSP